MTTPLSNKTAATDALVGIWTVLLTSFVIAALYFGRDILIPIALAALLTFLFAPLVSRLERWLGRIGAVLLVVMLIFAGVGGGGWVLTHQLVDLAAKLPNYKVNIQTKLRSFKMPSGGTFSKFSDTMEELKKDLPGSGTPEVSPASGKSGFGQTPKPAAAPAVPVQVVESTKSNPLELVETIIAPLIGPLGTAALVLILLIFMLLQREDLRSRMIRLIGQGRISSTTRAMDDAGSRVARYLLMQLIVNVTYGVPVAVGLWFIGVPNAILWGAFSTVLRFIPYIGPWIAAAFPITLSLAVSPTWVMPLLTVGLFVTLELLSNNVMEPWLYGSSTGVSPIALIVAAVFWTWLWGSVGLVLATPLTVCMVVMGRHIPRMAFLSVLLSDEEALTPAEDCYHRLLTIGEHDEMELVDSYLKANSLLALYDAVLVPVVTAAATDNRHLSLDDEQLALAYQSLRDIIDDLGARPIAPAKPEAGKVPVEPEPLPALPPPVACRVYCIPSRGERDELVGAMFAQLLQRRGVDAQNAAGKLVAGELIGLVEKADVDVVCISVVPPSTVIHARYLCLKLRARFPRMKILVGLWGAVENLEDATKRLRDSGADEIATTLADGLTRVTNLAPPALGTSEAAPIPADEEERLAALHSLDFIHGARDPVLDRITAKLARVLEVEVALVSIVDRDREFFRAHSGLPEELAKSQQVPREVSICSHVVAKNELLIIEDLARDRRFAANPIVKTHGFRFYAGMPLRAPGGQPIGTLCVLDSRPRQFTARDQRILQEYATEITEAFGVFAKS